jgi:hypothetical protein
VSSAADALVDPASPTAVLSLASTEACADPDVIAALGEARRAAFAVLPIGREEYGLHVIVPDVIGGLTPSSGEWSRPGHEDRPAVDFQERLDCELADKAFVLLLESATASGSDWVRRRRERSCRSGV